MSSSSSRSGGSGPQQRRGNTRQRIQDVALELFAEQGYEKTSLREIAERLDVTKAALYYHFKTKEDIIISVFDDVTRPIDELIEWAQEQPRTLEMKREVLRRYSEAMAAGRQLYRFMQENQATMRELSIGETVKQRLFRLVELLRTDEGPLTDQVRCVSALFTLHAGMMFLQHVEGDPEETRQAALEVATDLITQAHHHQV
ncbi:TetR/AcrR family transcriptional regulator [Streptomyces sp. NBC_00249]|uniref:TetR/AcrR family transcriptional regulator n=1 Tax=Streptomyces sp. NBC_00249 TaxID=2975690 RepID=UPI0022546BD1|nr:TetR/AcrR family transcriptional regulator [Streptomyces sp. NBC_00249]MCX5194688.1 TetR/AcrR family transcriptional regulator [Streptomyces sp. NBC_00249]